MDYEKQDETYAKHIGKANEDVKLHMTRAHAIMDAHKMCTNKCTCNVKLGREMDRIINLTIRIGYLRQERIDARSRRDDTAKIHDNYREGMGKSLATQWIMDALGNERLVFRRPDPANWELYQMLKQAHQRPLIFRVVAPGVHNAETEDEAADLHTDTDDNAGDPPGYSFSEHHWVPSGWDDPPLTLRDNKDGTFYVSVNNPQILGSYPVTEDDIDILRDLLVSLLGGA